MGGAVRRRGLLLAAAVLPALLALLAVLVLGKVLQPNLLLARRYPVWGVDVSRYQGTVDWQKMAEQGVGFAFIKATEGSGTVDGQFEANFRGAAEAGIPSGAYHFFSFDSAPEAQAEHFIGTVGALSGRLPPVVDAEYYGGYFADPPPKETVRRNLRRLLELLEAEYGAAPILYTTYPFYIRYLRGAFDDVPLWLRNVYTPPLPGQEWLFWQYTDTARLDGYDGEEPNIDRNVFSGSRQQLQALLLP